MMLQYRYLHYILTTVDTFYLLFQVDPANIEGLKSRLEQKDKEICALKQAAKVGYSPVFFLDGLDNVKVIRGILTNILCSTF